MSRPSTSRSRNIGFFGESDSSSLFASVLAACAGPGGPAVLTRCRRCVVLLASALAALAGPGAPAVLARCRRCVDLLASALAALAGPGGPAVLTRGRVVVLTSFAPTP